VASFRRCMGAQYPSEVRHGEVVVIWRPPIDLGEEAQANYGYLGVGVDRRESATGSSRSRWCGRARDTCSCIRCCAWTSRTGSTPMWPRRRFFSNLAGPDSSGECSAEHFREP
jgi:hypothetical protein